jgi:pimeloyl-ACP methyl ester carboxylesterase
MEAVFMRTHIGGLAVEITRPESAKFHHPLLLLHGFWTGSWIWEPLMTYLAHRGWESWAPSIWSPSGGTSSGWRPSGWVPSGAAVAAEIEHRTRALDAIVGAMPAPPIVITHDVGLLAIAASAARVPPPAMVAIAPVVAPASASGARGFLAWPQFWRARLIGGHVPPPRGVGARAFLGGAITVRDRLRADSAGYFRAVASGRVRLPPRIEAPGLVLRGGDDPLTPEDVALDVAAHFGWEERTIPGRGHFAMLESGWEELADQMHRWIVRTLGADLLAFLEEDADADPFDSM